MEKKVMKKWIMVLALGFVLAVGGSAFAGPMTRTMMIFPHHHVIFTPNPDHGANPTYQEERCFPYYYWEKLSCEEYFGLEDGEVTPSCVEEPTNACSYRQKIEFFLKCGLFSADPGQGSEPPWIKNPDKYRGCFYAEEDQACFKDAFSCETYEIGEEPVEYEELVTNTKVGDTINLGFALWFGGKLPKAYKLTIALVPPTTKEPQLIKDYGKVKPDPSLVDANGVYKPADEVFTFETPGVYRFRLKVWKPDGEIGVTNAKIIVVE
jgi:hypothetical protein